MKLTTHPKRTDFEETWYLLDGEGTVLGRLASQVALLVRGKHLPSFSPSVEPKTHCVVVNSEKIELTGGKFEKKKYRRHTTRPGSMHTKRAWELQKLKPEELVLQAVRRMLPSNTLGRRLLRKVRVYRGSEHPHEAQQPIPLETTDRGELEFPIPTKNEGE